jgi:glutathionylspermidine synthase
MWGRRSLPGVLVMDQTDAELLERSVPEILEGLFSLPERVYGGDHGRYVDDLGLVGERRDFLASTADVAAEPYGRADIYPTVDGWKLLEFNVASDLGGVERSVASTEAARSVALADAKDTLSMLGEALRARALRLGLPFESISIVVGSDYSPSLAEMLRSLRSALMAATGIRVEVLELSALTFAEGRVLGPHGPVHAVVRYFTVEHALSSVDGCRVRELVDAARAGGCILWTPLNSSMFSNKAALVLLAESLDTGAVTISEDARNLLVPGFRAAGRVDLDSAADWILKETTAAAGGGTVCSWEINADTWTDALNRSAATAVVQQRVVPAPVDVGGTLYNVVIGLFIIDGRAAGFDARCAPVGSGDVIGWTSNPATLVAPVIVDRSR